jgi:hypothetical protein
LERESYYRSDLVDLFGTPDGSKKGYIGSKDKPLCWDWGTTGFKKITQILHFLSGEIDSSFDQFYSSKIAHKENIIRTLKSDGIIDANPQMLYIFKYSSKRIPAFTAEIEEISWKTNEQAKWRIWLTYKPNKIFFIDPTAWKKFWDKLFTKGREDATKWYTNWSSSWSIPRPNLSDVEKMVHSGFSQDQFHIIPIKLLLDEIYEISNPSSNKPRIFLTKNVFKNDKRAKMRVPTDNQAFWGLLSEVVGKTQVRGNAEIRFGRQKYSLADIPANTIIENGWVFMQEIGTAIIICQVLLDIFGQDYIDLEFSNGNKKSILDSIFLKRAIKVSMIAKNYNSKYGETDFDYQLDLTPLARKHPNVEGKILFDLTAGLWNKSIAKDKEEFVAQWEHNLLKFPEQNPELQVIWHYGLDSEIKDGSYKGEEIGEYLKNRTKMSVVKYQPNSITNLTVEPKLILLPFFRDSTVQLEKELRQISNDKTNERRKSTLYGALNELLKQKI